MLKLKFVVLEKPNEYSLIVYKTRLRSLSFLLRNCLDFIIFGILFYYLLLDSSIDSFQSLLENIQQLLSENNNPDNEISFFILFALSIFFISRLPDLIKEIWSFFHPNIFCFNSLSKNITINKRLKIHFDEVSKLRIQQFSRSRYEYEYRLSIIIKGKKNIKIIQLEDFEEICDIASEISDLMNLSMVHSDFIKTDSSYKNNWKKTNIINDDWDDWKEPNINNDDW